MSRLLDQVAREDAERAALLALTDAELAADLAEDVNKGERRHAVNDRCAMELQVQHMREVGAL